MFNIGPTGPLYGVSEQSREQLRLGNEDHSSLAHTWLSSTRLDRFRLSPVEPSLSKLSLPLEGTSSEPRPGRRDARLRPTLLWEKGRTSTHRRHPSRGRFREEAGIGPYGYDAAVGYILEQYQA